MVKYEKQEKMKITIGDLILKESVNFFIKNETNECLIEIDLMDNPKGIIISNIPKLLIRFVEDRNDSEKLDSIAFTSPSNHKEGDFAIYEIRHNGDGKDSFFSPVLIYRSDGCELFLSTRISVFQSAIGLYVWLYWRIQNV